MHAEFIGVWSEARCGIWLPPIDHEGVPEDIFCELYRDLARALKDKPSVDALAGIIDHPVQLGIHEVRFEGVLEHGFWLYVRELTPADRAPVYYVGRTGDSSSTNAQSPFNRMGQHLGFAKNSNMLRRHLMQHGAIPESCAFRLIALGPIEQEAKGAPGRRAHDQRRDLVAAMEMALANLLESSRLQVMNRVVSRKPLDEARFAQVRAAFAKAFPQLAAAATPVIDEPGKPNRR